MKGKLSSGFEYEIDERALESYEVLELLSKASDNPIYYPQVFEVILGKEQKTRLVQFLKVDGFTSVESMNNALTEMFDSAKSIKNLSTSLE